MIIPDNHFCFLASIQSDLCAYVEVRCMYCALHVFPERCTDWPSAAPFLSPPCDGLSCSAASGSERGIITRCPSAGVFSFFLFFLLLAWLESPGSHKAFALLQHSIPGRGTNPRLPRHGSVSTNENSHQKIEGRPVKLVIFLWPPLLVSGADQFFTHSSPIRRACNIMRTSRILTREAR